MATTDYQYQLAKTSYELWLTMLTSMGVTVSNSPLGYAEAFGDVEDNVKIQLLREVEFHLTAGNGRVRGRVTPEQSHLYWQEAAVRNAWAYQQWREDPVANAVTTVTNATNLFTDTNNGLAIGDAIYFTAAVIPIGLTAGRYYYVLTVPDANTWTVAASPGGATQGITGDGTTVIWNQAGAAPKVVNTTAKTHHLVTDWRNVPREMRLRYQVLDAVLYGGLTQFADSGQAALGISGSFGPGNAGGTSPTTDGAGNTVTAVFNSQSPAWGVTDGGLSLHNLIL